MNDWTLKEIYDCIVDEGVDYVYDSLDFDEYDLTDKYIDVEIEDDIKRIIEEYFENGAIYETLDSALIYTQDCENLLGELGIGFSEMIDYYKTYGCDTVEGCAGIAVTEWCYGKQSGMEEEIFDGVKDKITEEYGVQF